MARRPVGRFVSSVETAGNGSRERNRSMEQTNPSLLGDGIYAGKAPGLKPVTSKGGQHAFFSCWDLHAYYGESYIVQGVSFDIREGEIVALLGRNGAGKTSTLRTIARLADPELKHGEIWLDHKPLHKMKAHQAAQVGIGLVPEDRRIIPGLSVEENLTLAQITPPIGWSIERIYELFPRLGERRNQEGITLSGGEQQMLAIGRALARDVKLLLLDEPYEGLAPVIVQEIERTLERIKTLGITTVIVEQNAIAALHLADRAIILDMGQVVFDGVSQEVLDNADLRQQYLAI
jgi:branched-chain amino acid transport system ATP-binding protein